MSCTSCWRGDCREGNTALHLACQSNQLKAIEVLLQWGARANMTNASGFAPVSTLSAAMLSTLCCFEGARVPCAELGRSVGIRVQVVTNSLIG